MKTLYVVCISVLIFGSASVTRAQLYAPEGLNIPGSWSTNVGGSWANPPALPVFAGIIDTVPPIGKFVLDTTLATRRYRTIVNVQSSGGDVAGGTYKWLFTSPFHWGQFDQTPWGNKWKLTPSSVDTVIMNAVQDYGYSGFGSFPSDSNFVVLVDGNYYTVNYLDAGYTASKAIWMRTPTPPVGIASVTQSPLPGTVDSTDTVTVTVTLAGSKSAEEYVFVRYTANNFTSSTVVAVPIFGITGTAKIPPQAGGSTVKYYAFTTTNSFPVGDYDLQTLKANNNNKLYYSYTVNASQYTINATSGANGSINPSGLILVTPGQDKTFTFTPSGGYVVDVVTVDGFPVDSTASYTFVNVNANHTIDVTFAFKVNITFNLNMSKKMNDGVFRPDSGDIVTIRGGFNGWGNVVNTDTLFDANNDSIYTITKFVTANQEHQFKFWKSDRGGQGYETSIGNRAVTASADTTLPAVYFDNDVPPAALVNVAFRVNMSVKMKEGTFRPDLGDRVQVKGGFNGWGGTDTLTDGDNDSIYVKTLGIAENSAISYKFWKTLRGGFEWEDNIADRSFNVPSADTTIPVVFFDDDNTVGVNVTVAAGWNMISNPVSTTEDSVSQLYPGSSFPYAFAFVPATGYVQRHVMENGTGYWGKFASGSSGQIPGAFILQDTIPVAPGWNMIGTISLPVDTAAIVQIPAGIVVTDYFGYSGTYYSAPTLNPGQAYWVKANAAGSLVLANTAAPAGRPAALQTARANPMGKLSSMTITDAQGARQVLYIGLQGQLNVPAERLELPPAGPEGVFDARFASGRRIELLGTSNASVELPVDIATAAYPLTVSWEMADGSASGLVLSDALAGKFVAARAIAGSGTMQVQNPAVKRLVLRTTASEIPAEFALLQNYPNPFNPTTSIRYALPVDARVTVKVFDVLGREIATLADELQNAGVKSVVWDGHNASGSQVASGLYFYRMEAQPTGNGSGFTSTKKMMLLK